MKFIDECQIEVSGGKGGNGIISFRRESKVPRGGPDGGDGGQGGSVFFIPNSGVNTLLNIKFLRYIKAQDGENGRAKNQYGASGQDSIIKVPYGTLVYVDNRLIHDITQDKPYLIAKGGKGGKGNVKFKTSRNSAPRLSENGLPGQHFKINLVLKVLADVGFVGKPSAGKSTLLSVISNAKPKIADYEFTTLTPQLGLVKTENQSFVVADLPGLIKGASLGKGLGHDFLKHIERCRVIAHIIDFGTETKNPVQDYQQIRSELISYSPSLGDLKELIIANKNDLPLFNQHLATFKKQYPNLEVMNISALTQNNLESLKMKLMTLLQQTKTSEIDQVINDNQETTIDAQSIGLIKSTDKFMIKKISQDKYDVTGPAIVNIINLIPLNSNQNINRFNYKLKSLGVWKELLSKGIKVGDIVKIGSHELEWSANDNEDTLSVKDSNKKDIK